MRRQRGQALTEYVAVAVFLMIIVWYALVGGTTNSAGEGGLYETDVGVVTKGTYAPASEDAQPGLIQALHFKQENFQQQIYQP